MNAFRSLAAGLLLAIGAATLAWLHAGPLAAILAYVLGGMTGVALAAAISLLRPPAREGAPARPAPA
ncbi:hypothetical protein OG2516_14965 [Oceanicola granulosus HTCC2516]|uniref:Uncharacterized protein n=1 Tax=Oceanicola granulosus (strain ATCC BAA-861 / DSM 15982 / KCTC 12143 / HTCC2516) TaxID=314256 RepID=Q2CES2_OCEGH|nr:hypothetical protein [Oceanicola granulosus]EAR51186.1 hypothetical protein OG2516_14965 [Oceanicola granulosus HTCC2516]